jgi:hypothetical protein
VNELPIAGLEYVQREACVREEHHVRQRKDGEEKLPLRMRGHLLSLADGESDGTRE